MALCRKGSKKTTLWRKKKCLGLKVTHAEVSMEEIKVQVEDPKWQPPPHTPPTFSLFLSSTLYLPVVVASVE